jgi:hypothetical protein
MQDPPDLAELLESVRCFLETEVVPAAPDARLRFRALVAANVLAVAGREKALEEELLKAEEGRLWILLGPGRETGRIAMGLDDLRARVAAQNAELARRIRAGAINAAPGSPVWAHLRQTVIEKLRIANPQYLERLSGRASGEQEAR